MERQWCVYGWLLGAWGVGKVEERVNNTLWISYSNESTPVPWEKKWVKRFDANKEALKEFFRTNCRNVCDFKYIEHMKECFPDEDWS